MEIERATLQSIDEKAPFVVECDASDVAISATLNQGGRPVAFMSRSFQKGELHYPSVEKEATAVIEAVRKWSHFLARQHFTLITDQRPVAFMLDNRRRTKVKNNKIQSWRLELASFSYTIKYRPGRDNAGPDTLTRAFCSSISDSNLEVIHNGLCHPGVARLLHFVRSKNLPFSTEDVKKTCSSCRTCAELKPHFFLPQENTLIKATQPFERISIDFKGPLPTVSRNKYLLTVIDEYSRFPFAFACPDMHSRTVIKCLDQLFSLCGMPSIVHSDNQASFMSSELKEYLLMRGIASSKSTPYHPTGNSQVERYNGVIWKAIRLRLKSLNLHTSRWEVVLPDALYSVRSLLCTTTNSTPHERFFSFTRRSPNGKSLPAWLTSPGPVFLRKFVRSHKNDDLVEEVELTDVNPTYARVRFADGRESNVSIRDLAPCPRSPNKACQPEKDHQTLESAGESGQAVNDGEVLLTNDTRPEDQEAEKLPVRRSTRVTRGIPPQRYGIDD